MKNWPKFSGEIGRHQRSKSRQTPSTDAQTFLFVCFELLILRVQIRSRQQDA